MSMEISYPNTGLISPNYDAINKANKILAGKTAEDLKANTSGTMQELSTEEVREMREKARNEQRTLNVDRSEIVNNVYWKTGDNITYNVDGVSFTNEEMKACKEVVKNAIAALPTKGSDLDYEDYAAMGIAANMVNTYATEHLTVGQAEVINKSINDYLDSVVQSASNKQLADTIRTLFQNLNLRDHNAVNGAFARYREIMSPVYRATGIENTVNHNSLSNVLKQDENRFSMQIANAKAVLNSIGSSVNISV